MIEENALVVKDEKNGFVWVETRRLSGCGACAERQGCGTSALAGVLGRRQAPLRVVNSIGATVGEQVVIGVSESGLLRGSLAVYAIPLLGLFIGALAGYLFGDDAAQRYVDFRSVLGGAVGLAAGLAWLRRFSRATAQDERYQPVTLRRAVPFGSHRLGIS